MIRSAIRRFLLILSTGYILMFFSEHLFWARFRPGSDDLANYLSTWIAYSLAGYATLAIISTFRVRRAAAVFLAGAAFGWLVEGVIVGTTYEALPLSISFTGLAWHAPLSVGIGLGLIPIILSRHKALAVPTAIATGFFFGAWGINWTANEAEYHASAGEFILFAAITTILLLLAYGVFCATRRIPIRIHPAERIFLLVLAGFFFCLRVAAQPIAACVWPLLMGATFLTLWRNRRMETDGSLLEDPLPAVSGFSLISLLLIPLAAVAVYAPVVWLDLKIPTNIVFYLLLTPLGFILYFVSMIRIWFPAPGKSPEDKPGAPSLPECAGS